MKMDYLIDVLEKQFSDVNLHVIAGIKGHLNSPAG
jgi:hypothetical protein